MPPGTVRRWTYPYDERDRLMSATATNVPAGQPGSFASTYNSLGNITAGPLGAYTYGTTQPHAVTAAGVMHHDADAAAGNVVTRQGSGPTSPHTYNLEGRPGHRRHQGARPPPSSTTATAPWRRRRSTG
jgi:hypothetical protein